MAVDAPGGRRLAPAAGLCEIVEFRGVRAALRLCGRPARSHWPGPPIAIVRTLAGTPYRFHWHGPDSDVGNTLITGRTGSGKTTLVSGLIALTAGRARVVALDHKQGWRFLVDRMDGEYAVLGLGEPHFAPLKALDASPRNVEFLTDLMRGCIGGEMTEEEGRRLSLGLETIMQLPSESRCLGELRHSLVPDRKTSESVSKSGAPAMSSAGFSTHPPTRCGSAS